MKRILTIFAVCVTAFVACQKGDTAPKEATRLVGSSYRTDGYRAIMSIFGYYYHILEFDTATTGVAYWTDSSGRQNGSDGGFYYRLEYPDLYVTEDEDGDTLHYRFEDSRSFFLVAKDGTINKSMDYYKMD